MSTEIRVGIKSATDIVAARHQGRFIGAEIGFEGSDLTVIATAISEVARNILEYARRGEIILRREHSPSGRRGITIVAHDQGPGIPNVALAMQDGFSTGRGLGLGLPGAKRLMDDFEIVSKLGDGTTITMRKWLPDRA